jgi:type IX secretion system PorP/SprF family membrane protein
MNFKNRTLNFAVTIVTSFTINTQAQISNSPTAFHNYYYDYKLANPAFTGTKAKHVITTVYQTVPSTSPQQQLVYGSYERHIQSIKSGIGGIFIYDRLGPYTRTQVGALYSKQLPFSETNGLELGTQLFYQRMKFDYDLLQVIDGDPLLADGEETKTNVNVDFGMVYYSPDFTLGASVKNILKQQQSFRYAKESSALLNLVVTRDFKITEQLKVTPSVLFVTDFDNNDV